MAAFTSFKRYIGMEQPRAAAKGRTAPTTADLKPADFAQLLITMSRLLNQLDAQPGLAKEKLGIAEWVALTVLSGPRKMTEKRLAKSLGVSPRRAREIAGSLQRADKVIAAASATAGAREIELTEAGQASLDRANDGLMRSLKAVLKGRERTLVSATKQIRLLVQVAKRAS